MRIKTITEMKNIKFNPLNKKNKKILSKLSTLVNGPYELFFGSFREETKTYIRGGGDLNLPLILQFLNYVRSYSNKL